MIHDSDNDNDLYAKLGLGKLKGRIFLADRSMTIFHIVNRFTRWGANSADLTINIDEEEPGVADHVRFEQNLIFRFGPRQQSGESGERIWNSRSARHGQKTGHSRPRRFLPGVSVLSMFLSGEQMHL